MDANSYHRIDFSNLLEPPQAVAEFVHTIIDGMRPARDRRSKARSTPDRRMNGRYKIPVIVDVQPVDDGFSPQGTPYQVVAHDLSPTGIGVRDVKPVNTKYLALQVTSPTGDQMQMLAEVARCELKGSVYNIGARFVNYRTCG